jgi:hypothetical protein
MQAAVELLAAVATKQQMCVGIHKTRSGPLAPAVNLPSGCVFGRDVGPPAHPLYPPPLKSYGGVFNKFHLPRLAWVGRGQAAKVDQ